MTVRERASVSVKSDAKSEPLKRKGCDGAGCSKGKPGYRIQCEGCKNKWHQAPIVRVVASIGLHGDQGEDQAPTLADRGGGGRAGRGGRGTGRGGRRAQGTS